MPDYVKYVKDFHSAAKQCGLSMEPIGEVLGKEVLFASNELDQGRPGILIFSGFHGEEFAGPLGLLQFLQSPEAGAVMSQLNVGIVPVTNPDGFDRGIRYNRLRQEDNWALRFWPDGEPSLEGQVLLANLEKIGQYATTCFLDMHEDDGADGFYMYAFAHGGQIEPWHSMVLDVGLEHFPIQPDGPIPSTLEDEEEEDEGSIPTQQRPETNAIISNGIIWADYDGSFDELFHKRGAFMSAVTETPAREELKLRMDCNEKILRNTLELVSSMPMRVAARIARMT